MQGQVQEALIRISKYSDLLRVISLLQNTE